jgi:hypothetical protein
MTQTKNDIIKEAALKIAHIHLQSEPGIVRIYWFPSNKELRLVEVDETMPELIEGNRLQPLYFEANPAKGLSVPMAYELIAPTHEEHLRNGKIAMPKGWGKWETGERIYPVS